MVFNTLDPITLYVMAIDFQRLLIFYVIFKAPGPIYGHWFSMPGPHEWPEIFNYFQYPGPHNGLLTSLVFNDCPCFSIIFNDFQNPWTHIWPMYKPYIPHMKGHGSHIWPIYGPCMAHSLVITNDFQWCSVPLASYNVNVMAIDVRCLDPI